MNYSALENTSLKIYAQESVLNLYWSVASPISIVANAFVLATILATKDLHNPTHYIIFSHSFSEMLFGFTRFGLGIKRYSQYLTERPLISTQLLCMMEQMPIYFAGMMVKDFSFALALDRFLGINAPVFYKTTNPLKYASIVNLVVWSHCVLKVGLGFLNFDPFALFPSCTYVTGFDPLYSVIITYEENVVSGAAAFLYVANVVVLWKRYRKAKPIGETQKRAWKKQMELDVFVAISVIGLIYFVGSVIPTIFNSIIVQSGTIDALKLTRFKFTMVMISCSSHLLVYLKFNSSFRKGFRRMLICARQNNAVASGGRIAM